MLGSEASQTALHNLKLAASLVEADQSSADAQEFASSPVDEDHPESWSLDHILQARTASSGGTSNQGDP